MSSDASPPTRSVAPVKPSRARRDVSGAAAPAAGVAAAGGCIPIDAPPRSAPLSVKLPPRPGARRVGRRRLYPDRRTHPIRLVLRELPLCHQPRVVVRPAPREHRIGLIVERKPFVDPLLPGPRRQLLGLRLPGRRRRRRPERPRVVLPLYLLDRMIRHAYLPPGRRITWPSRILSGFVISGFKTTIARTVVPARRAIAESVSPRRPVYAGGGAAAASTIARSAGRRRSTISRALGARSKIACASARRGSDGSLSAASISACIASASWCPGCSGSSAA